MAKDSSAYAERHQVPSALPPPNDGRQARGLRFLRWSANCADDHKYLVRPPDFKDRLGAANAAKKAQIERARAIAEDPVRLRRIEARSEIIATRNIRITERERVRREAIARQAAERAAAEAFSGAGRALITGRRAAHSSGVPAIVPACRRVLFETGRMASMLYHPA